MKKKPLELSYVDLSKEQLIELFNISFEVIGLVRHDLIGGSLRGFSFLMETLSEKLIERPKKESTREITVEYLTEEFQDVKKSAETVSRLFYQYFSNVNSFDVTKNFISSPQKIVDSIRNLQKNSNILIGKGSATSLEIIYPANVLFGILTELIQNSTKHNWSLPTKILITWCIKGDKFICEVHDNGPGIVPKKEYGSYPLGTLYRKYDLDIYKNSGLRIIERIVVLSQGLLLFSRSKKLGGTRTYFEIPVIGHN